MKDENGNVDMSPAVGKIEYLVPKDSRFLCPNCGLEGALYPGDHEFVCKNCDYQNNWMPVFMHTVWAIWEDISSR